MSLNDPARVRLDRAFHIRTKEGVLLETFDKEEDADDYAIKANGRAFNLGIATRYVVSPKEETA